MGHFIDRYRCISPDHCTARRVPSPPHYIASCLAHYLESQYVEKPHHFKTTMIPALQGRSSNLKVTKFFHTLLLNCIYLPSLFIDPSLIITPSTLPWLAAAESLSRTSASTNHLTLCPRQGLHQYSSNQGTM